MSPFHLTSVFHENVTKTKSSSMTFSFTSYNDMADFCVQKRSLFHKNGPICRFFYSRGSYIAFKLTYHGAFRLGRAVCERVGFPGEGPLEHQVCAHAHHGLKPRRLPGVQFLRSTLKQRKHLTEKGLKISCER